MMKRYLLFLLVTLAGWPAFAQKMADYYQLPSAQRQYDRLLTRYGGAYTRDRWYVSLSGFVRTDRAKLDNSFNGLLYSDRVTTLAGSALVGWSHREQWAVEAGYANMPIHTEVIVNSASYPYAFRFTNNRQGFVLRGKRMILSTSGPWRRSGFWLTGGLWLMPNNGQDKGQFALAGYGNKDSHWEKPDTIRLTGRTALNTNPTAMLETGVEYNLRLSNRFDMGFAVHKLWGLGNSLTTNVSYFLNGRDVQQAQLLGTGSGMSYGVTLRYNFVVRQTLAHVLDVQGKQRIK